MQIGIDSFAAAISDPATGIDARIYTDFIASWLSFRVSIVRRLGTFS